jgi:hypothetical protein
MAGGGAVTAATQGFLPFPPPPSMLDLGWSCAHGKNESFLWTHESGARLEERGSALFGTYEFRVNGGSWQPGTGFPAAVEQVPLSECA